MGEAGRLQKPPLTQDPRPPSCPAQARAGSWRGRRRWAWEAPGQEAGLQLPRQPPSRGRGLGRPQARGPGRLGPEGGARRRGELARPVDRALPVGSRTGASVVSGRAGL